MDLVHNMKKADTYFLAIVVRRELKFANLRSTYDLVDASVLPLSLLEEKFRHFGNEETGEPANPLDRIREDRDERMRDGALGKVLVMTFELNAGEEKTIEQTVKQVGLPCPYVAFTRFANTNQKSIYTLQPLGLFKEHYEQFKPYSVCTGHPLSAP